MQKVLELKQKRAKLIHEARAMLDKVEEEKRSFTAEEEEQYNRIDADIDKMGADIERREKQIERERRLGEPGADDVDDKRVANDDQGADERRTLSQLLEDRGALDSLGMNGIRGTEEYREAFSRWLVNGSAALTADEYRAMQVDSDVGGGYLVTPQQMVLTLLKNVDDIAVIRQYATVHQLRTAKSLGVPTLETDAEDAEWTAELRTGGETELEFGKRELRPHPLAKRAKISNTLLRMGQLGPESIVRERLAYKFGVTQEKAYLTGDGNQKPLGVFTPSADGISTGRDVADGNTATKLTPDNLINCKYGLKGAYHARARWIFHRYVLREIRKMKDGNGQYIWQPGITGGAPDRILELPYTLSEFAPSELKAGAYVGILGDFRFYWIAEALDMQMQRLVELYAETNQTGFIGRYEGDGMPVLEEAFVRVKMGS